MLNRAFGVGGAAFFFRGPGRRDFRHLDHKILRDRRRRWASFRSLSVCLCLDSSLQKVSSPRALAFAFALAFAAAALAAALAAAAAALFIYFFSRQQSHCLSHRYWLASLLRVLCRLLLVPLRSRPRIVVDAERSTGEDFRRIEGKTRLGSHNLRFPEFLQMHCIAVRVLM